MLQEGHGAADAARPLNVLSNNAAHARAKALSKAPFLSLSPPPRPLVLLLTVIVLVLALKIPHPRRPDFTVRIIATDTVIVLILLSSSLPSPLCCSRGPGGRLPVCCRVFSAAGPEARAAIHITITSHNSQRFLLGCNTCVRTTRAGRAANSPVEKAVIAGGDYQPHLPFHERQHASQSSGWEETRTTRHTGDPVLCRRLGGGLGPSESRARRTRRSDKRRRRWSARGPAGAASPRDG